MNKIHIALLNKPSCDPVKLLTFATQLTYLESLNGQELMNKLEEINPSEKLIGNIIKMNHPSILEHCNYTYLIEGASRSFLSQITRHRLFSFTSASQHYIDYSNIGDFEIPIEILQTGNQELIEKYYEVNKMALDGYKQLQEEFNIPHEVARQVLPNSMRNNLLVTGNIRQWMNFLNLRMCERNTSEIQYVANEIYKDLHNEIPEIINDSLVGPDCWTTKCRQGHKACKINVTEEYLEEKFAILKNTNEEDVLE